MRKTVTIKIPVYVSRFFDHLQSLGVMKDYMPSMESIIRDSGDGSLVVYRGNSTLVCAMAKLALEHISLIRSGAECGWDCQRGTKEKLVSQIKLKLREMESADKQLSTRMSTVFSDVDKDRFYRTGKNAVIIRLGDCLSVFRCSNINHAIEIAGKGELREFCLSKMDDKTFKRCQWDHELLESIYYYGDTANSKYRRRSFFKS